MARNDSKFIVPLADQKEFDRMVQRANRRIQANLKFIQEENISSPAAQRALAHDYIDVGAWHTSKTVFSRSKIFDSENDYKAFIRHVKQWGDKRKYDRSVDAIKEGYVKAAVRALTTVAIDNGNGILLKNGRLPGNLVNKIRGLSLEQLSNWFAHGDPGEEVETQGWKSDLYIGVDRGEFVDITLNHINNLKQLYPDRRPLPMATKAKAKRPKSKSRSAKRKSQTKRKRKKSTKRKKKK